MNLEELIFANLLQNEEYGRKVIPFMKDEYFTSKTHLTTFKLLSEHVKKYNRFPTKEALLIDLSNCESLNEETFEETKNFISKLESSIDKDLEWLVDNTEKFCQDKAIYNAIMDSIKILDEKEEGRGKIPQILSDALGVSFDSHVGHDFILDSESRFDFYRKKEKKVAFDLEYLNKITKNGVATKTLNVILAGTGVGKSLAMCHFAAANLMQGLNVLYITMEMAEERIAERIDANLLNIPMDELDVIPREVYESKIERLKEKVKGRLIIKEYPTAQAGAGHFRHLLHELKIKKNFVCDVLYIDYLNICTSSRLKYGSNVNSYTYIKSIAEELRGLAVEFNIPLITATQTNRTGFTNSDVGLEDTSESFGLPATADLMFALISSEELDALNQIMVKQLKNRYNSPAMHRRFVLGVDRSKMRLYDVEQSAQEDIMEDTPVMDNSKFGDGLKSERRSKKFDRKVFEDFK